MRVPSSLRAAVAVRDIAITSITPFYAV